MALIDTSNVMQDGQLGGTPEASPAPAAGVAVVASEQQVLADWLALRLRDVGLALGGRVVNAAGLEEAVESAGATLVVSEATLPGGDPMAMLAAARRRRPSLRCAILDRDACPHQIEAALRAGASAYFTKADDPESILRGLRRAHDGRLAFGAAATDACPTLRDLQDKPVKSARGFSASDGSGLSRLTPREREVLALMGQGLWRTEIAERLCRSPKTIDKHRASIMKKLDVHDHAALVLLTVREGLVDPEHSG
jgi:DNA-binding NarL/FixJ family response regulator